MAKGKAPSQKIKFHTTLLQSKKTATGLEIPEQIITQLGAGRKPPVKVTISGYTYRSSIAFMNGVFMLGVSAAIREQTGLEGGDPVDVELELDTKPREVTLPPDFKKALDADAKAKTFFNGLSYSNKQRYVLPFDLAKTVETRQRRIDKAISDLREGKK